MFSPKRAARLLGRFLLTLLVTLGPLLVLAFVTQLTRLEEGDRLDGLFWLSVLRNVVPGLAALLAVYVLALRFVRDLYALPTRNDARNLVNHCLWGLWSFGPWLRVANGAVEGDPNHTMRRVGGPGNLVIYNDTAVLLEQGGRFTKIETTGFPPLRRFEKIYAVVDLRPIREVYPVSAMSKEGIPVTCEAEITYQLKTPEDFVPTAKKPFSAEGSTVLTAGTCTWIREPWRPDKYKVMTWGGRVIISETEGALRSILARYPLNRLIGLLIPKEENLREKIRQDLEARLREQVPKLGAQILNVALGDIKVDDEVTQQWIEAWQAELESRATQCQGAGRAKQIEQLEKAKTQAQVMMLNTLAEALHPLGAASDMVIRQPLDEKEVTSKLILARLFMALSQVAADPITRVYLPQEALNTLKLLKEIKEL